MAEISEKTTFSALIADVGNVELLGLARVTESCERYEDMCELMGKIVKNRKTASVSLSVEERNMLSVAYKNVVGQRRASWRNIKADLQNEDDLTKKEQKQDYLKVVEGELHAKCDEVLELLKDNLLAKPEVQDSLMEDTKKLTEGSSADEKLVEKELETQVFYLKMSGDYYRYLAEFHENNEEFKKQAEKHYDRALTLAAVLPPTHPTRLGLALNASVCYWEILKKSQEACDLAKRAFDEAIQKLDSLSDSTYKDSTLIMQLLRDNLTIWTSDENREQQDPTNGPPEEDD